MEPEGAVVREVALDDDDDDDDESVVVVVVVVAELEETAAAELEPELELLDEPVDATEVALGLAPYPSSDPELDPEPEPTELGVPQVL